jgi:beta-phosphoglucomutase
MTVEIRALLFDLDGVITDTVEFHYLSWKQLTEEEGIPFSREHNELLRGLSRRESLAVILNGRAIEEAVAEDWMRRKNDYYLRYMNDMTPADRLPGVTELLTEARAAGAKTAVASASRNAHAVLERLELLDLFDAIVDAHCVVHSKPAPDLFLWAAGRLNVNPRQAVVFEDGEAGVAAALAGGFRVVGLGQANVAKAHVLAPDLSNVTLSWVAKQLEAIGTLPT